MKKTINFLLLIFGFAILLFSCSDHNPVSNPVNPYGNTDDAKFIFDFPDYVEVWEEGEIGGNVFVIGFDGNAKKYDIILGNKQQREFRYELKREYNASKLYIDSLSGLFLKYKLNNYPESVPFDIDTNAKFMWPSSFEKIYWRLDKTDTLKILNIGPKPYEEHYQYPDGFEDFHNELILLTNNL